MESAKKRKYVSVMTSWADVIIYFLFGLWSSRSKAVFNKVW